LKEVAWGGFVLTSRVKQNQIQGEMGGYIFEGTYRGQAAQVLTPRGPRTGFHPPVLLQERGGHLLRKEKKKKKKKSNKRFQERRKMQFDTTAKKSISNSKEGAAT